MLRVGWLLATAMLVGPGCLADEIRSGDGHIPSDRYADATWYRRGTLTARDDSSESVDLSFHVDSPHMRVALEWSSHGGDTCGGDGGYRSCGGFRLLRPDGTDAITESFGKGAKSVPHWYEQNAPLWGGWTLSVWAWEPVDYSVGAYLETDS